MHHLDRDSVTVFRSVGVPPVPHLVANSQKTASETLALDTPPLDPRPYLDARLRRTRAIPCIHVHGERKTRAVCDCHDFAAFAAFCGADTRAPSFAERKLASRKASLRSSFPRSHRSSASFCNKRVSSPERCHCGKPR
jgi:hypothetical protein